MCFWYKTRLFVGGALCGATLLSKVSFESVFLSVNVSYLLMKRKNTTPLTGFIQSVANAGGATFIELEAK
jgi:hypothetical protein